MEDGKNLISRLEGLPSAHPKHFRDLTKKVDMIGRQAATQTALDFIVEYLGGAFDEDFQRKLIERMNALPSTQPELIEKAAYIRGFEQGRTQGMIDSQGGKK